MKLHRFHYSPYARKVQMLLDLLGQKYDIVEVPYSDRTALAKLTSGYIYVPVLELDDGSVMLESRVITEYLVAMKAGNALVPAPWQGPIWAYHDYVDGPLEDVLFRIATPGLRDAWESPSDRALFVLVKERKYGAGCVTAWEHDRAALVARARRLLEPTLETLRQQPFLFGERPTLADAALYGNCAMLDASGPDGVAQVSEELLGFMRRLEAACPA